MQSKKEKKKKKKKEKEKKIQEPSTQGSKNNVEARFIIIIIIQSTQTHPVNPISLFFEEGTRSYLFGMMLT